MYDAVIIGSGPGGYECAKIVTELGGKAAIIEKDKLGGTCTNTGCIPTKALHASAELFNDVKKAEKMGFKVENASVDFAALMERKNKVVKTMSSGVKILLKNVEIIEGFGKIKDKETVTVNDQELKTKNIVIATGAHPRKLEQFENNEFVIDSTGVLELQEQPKSLTIIGGGYIGCEIASIFASIGTKVTIIEMLDRIAAIEDQEISAELAKMMRRLDVEVLTSAKIKNVDGNKITVDHEDEEKTVESEKILVSVGMVPNFDSSELDSVGIKHDKGVEINNKMQTSVENIYAIGDVTGKIMLAHHAYAQAEIAAKNIMGKTATFDESVVPSAIFTIPEISSVGVRNENLKSAKFLFAASGKARAMGEPDGFVKIYYEDGLLKGFSCIGPHASDLVAEATLAIKNKIPLEKIKETIHTHPTLSEAFSNAVEIALKNE